MIGGPACSSTPKEDLFDIAASLIKATSTVEISRPEVRNLWRFGKGAQNIGLEFLHSTSMAGTKAKILRYFFFCPFVCLFVQF